MQTRRTLLPPSPPPVSLASAAFDDPGARALAPCAERNRLDRHFRRVIRHLRDNPPRLTAAQAEAREAQLAALEAYRQRGRFPLNRDSERVRTPIFVDARGTHCAMGHLLALHGAGALVAAIARHRNLATIAELADIPELHAWLDDNGLTLDEAALIQPSYCGSVPSACACSNLHAGVVAGELETDPDAGLVLRVTEAYGDTGDDGAGSVLLVVGDTPYEAGDGVVAKYDLDGDVWVAKILVGVQPEGTVFAGCGFGPSPGSLPLDVYGDAVTASENAGCRDVLGAHDPAWNELPAGCEEEEVMDEGCTMHPGAPGGLSSLLLVATALLLSRWQR